MKNANKKIKLVTFGAGGDIAYLGSGSTCSGYGDPDNPHAAEGAPEGTPAIDMRNAKHSKEGIAMSVMGPMVDVDLADDEIDRCPTPSNLMAGAMKDSHYGTMMALQAGHKQTSDKAGPLDKVSTNEYIRLWRIAGARIGHVYRDGIVWEHEHEGTTS
jgi:hypothetical protein